MPSDPVSSYSFPRGSCIIVVGAASCAFSVWTLQSKNDGVLCAVFAFFGLALLLGFSTTLLQLMRNDGKRPSGDAAVVSKLRQAVTIFNEYSPLSRKNEELSTERQQGSSQEMLLLSAPSQ